MPAETNTPTAKRLVQVDLNTRPEDFGRVVAIPDAITNGVLRVRFVFRWRDRVEAAQFFDGLLKEARRSLASAQDHPEPDPAADAQAAIDRDIAILRDMATGWNIDAPFDGAHLTKFFLRYPGAAPAIATSYRTAVLAGE
jgi:hypothetical protein